MKWTFLPFLFSLTLLFSFTTPKLPAAPPGEWRMLGKKKVRFRVDRDVIHFANWRDDVRQIRLKITRGPLQMHRMVVHFDNGREQVVELRDRFSPGSESRIIDLNGGLRRLQKIEFWYETRGVARGRSQVSVWGRD